MTRHLGSKKRELAGRVGRVSCVGVCCLLSRRDLLRRIVVGKLIFYQVPILKSQRRVDNDEIGGEQTDKSKGKTESYGSRNLLTFLLVSCSDKSEIRKDIFWDHLFEAYFSTIVFQKSNPLLVGATDDVCPKVHEDRII